jgi:microcystin-dependent protein
LADSALQPNGNGSGLTGVWHPGDSVTNAVDATARSNNTLTSNAIPTTAAQVGAYPNDSGAAASNLAYTASTNAEAARVIATNAQAVADAALPASSTNAFAVTSLQITELSGPGTVPVGAIMEWWATNAPPGWLLLQGQSVSTGIYSKLFLSPVGSSFRISGTNMILPDARNRVVVGLGSGSFDSLGNTGGSETVTLTADQMPSHLHSVDPPSKTSTSQSASHYHACDPPSTTSSGQSATHTHSYYKTKWSGGSTLAAGSGAVSSESSDTSGNASGDHTHTVNIASFNSGNQSASHTHDVDIGAFNSASTGGDGAHSNMPPYIVGNRIIKF